MKEPKVFLKFTFISLFTITIFIYAFFQAKNIIIGPVVEIISPTNDETIEKSIIEIIGKTKNISYISMNDNQIFVDGDGVFREKLLLSYGYNIITINARDRFNREVKKTLELMYK